VAATLTCKPERTAGSKIVSCFLSIRPPAFSTYHRSVFTTIRRQNCNTTASYNVIPTMSCSYLKRVQSFYFDLFVPSVLQSNNILIVFSHCKY
jgi:hypothetical protein